MKVARRVYQLHAQVLENLDLAHTPEIVQREKLLKRFINRIERTATLYHGLIARRQPSGLNVHFDSAEQALYCACAMQRACGVIPRTPGLNPVLEVEIRGARPDVRSADGWSAERSAFMAEQETPRLDPSVAISEEVLDALPPGLHCHAVNISRSGVAGVQHLVDWPAPALNQPPSANPPEVPLPTVAAPVPPKVFFGEQTLILDETRNTLRIGRDADCDIVLTHPKASRQHCRIVWQQDSCVLVDLSTNGTYLTSRDGKGQVVKQSMQTLVDTCLMTFGMPYDRHAGEQVRFEVGNPAD